MHTVPVYSFSIQSCRLKDFLDYNYKMYVCCTPWLVNLPRRLILDQKVQCLATTDPSYLADVFLLSHVFVYPHPHNFNHFLRLN